VDSRADIIFQGAHRARSIMVDVPSISGSTYFVLSQVDDLTQRVFDSRTSRILYSIFEFFHWIPDQQR
jgi:hypothetical protein